MAIKREKVHTFAQAKFEITTSLTTKRSPGHWWTEYEAVRVGDGWFLSSVQERQDPLPTLRLKPPCCTRVVIAQSRIRIVTL